MMKAKECLYSHSLPLKIVWVKLQPCAMGNSPVSCLWNDIFSDNDDRVLEILSNSSFSYSDKKGYFASMSKLFLSWLRKLEYLILGEGPSIPKYGDAAIV